MKASWMIAAAAVAGLAAGASAQVHNEVGDAGDLAGGQLTGNGVLTEILGSFGATGDVDMYQIRVNDWLLFSASTVNVAGLVGAETDTQLFLFNASGIGIAMNDDSSAGGTLRSRLEAGSAVYSGRTNGEVVWIAVSGYDVDPNSAGGAIWSDTPYAVTRAPDGAGAAGALTGWSGTGSGGTYRIELTGASAVPTPGALALLGLGGVAVLRRRR